MRGINIVKILIPGVTVILLILTAATLVLIFAVRVFV